MGAECEEELEVRLFKAVPIFPDVKTAYAIEP